MVERPGIHTRIEDLTLPVPNETRLQELQSLAQRKQHLAPGPGSYEVVSATELRPGLSSRRRRHQPRLDGPFPLQPGECSLRSKQISGNLVLKDSGVSPTAYDGLMKKDVCLARAPTPKIGTARRGGPAPLTADQLCLSISKCLSSGLNWRAPLPLQQLQQQLTCRTPRPCAASTRPDGIRLRQSASIQGDINSSTGVELGRSSGPGRLQHASADSGANSQPQHLDHQQLHRQQWQLPCQVIQQQQQHEAQTSAGVCTAIKGHIPWQLARSIAEWDEVLQAVVEQQLQAVSQVPAAATAFCELQHAPSGGILLHPQQHHLRNLPRNGAPGKADSSEPPGQQQPFTGSRMSSDRPPGDRHHTTHKSTRQAAAMVLQEQVLQHESAARAAEAVAQLAARRQRWHELS